MARKVIQSAMGAVNKAGLGGIVDPFDITGAGAVDKARRQAVGAKADAETARVANEAAAAELAKKNAEEKAAQDKKAAGAADKTLEDTQRTARASALNDMLLGEGDESQRRKFLKGAK